LGDGGAELVEDGLGDVVGEKGDGGSGVENRGFGVVAWGELIGSRRRGGG
jgi:hypothetical protein